MLDVMKSTVDRTNIWFMKVTQKIYGTEEAVDIFFSGYNLY